MITLNSMANGNAYSGVVQHISKAAFLDLNLSIYNDIVSTKIYD